MNTTIMEQFRTVRRVYDWWGDHPKAYKVASWVDFMGRERYLRKAAVQAMAIAGGETVLDLGCGTGANFPALERVLTPAGRLIAFDYDPAMLRAARQRASQHGWRNIWLTHGDAAKLTLPQACLDGALATLAMSVVPDHLAAMRRVHQALKPGARFVVMDARPFTRGWRVLNPLIVPLFEQTTAWNTGIDPIDAMRQVFAHVSVQVHNRNSIFIVVATKTG